MTRDELIADIKSAGSTRTCAVNWALPTIAVTYDGEEYFFQGDEAKDMLKEAQSVPEVAAEDYILWLARGW